MTAFLALLTRALITVLFALTALLRFYGDDGFHLPYPPTTLVDLSFWVFCAAALLVVANLGLEWNLGNRSRYRADQDRDRAAEERERAAEERERAAARAQLQNRFLVLQIRHQLDPGDTTRAALRDFLALLEEYGD